MTDELKERLGDSILDMLVALEDFVESVQATRKVIAEMDSLVIRISDEDPASMKSMANSIRIRKRTGKRERDLIKSIFGDKAEQKDPEEEDGDEPENEEERADSVTEEDSSLTKEEVRAILAKAARAGFEHEVKDLLAKYKAKTLKDVDPKDYAALVAETEVLTNG